MKNDFDFKLFAPFVVVTGLSICALIVLIVMLAGQVDATSRDRERALVANGLQQSVAEAENTIAALASAGGVDRLQNRPPAGIARLIVLQGPSQAAAALPFAAEFGPLIEQVREADATTSGLRAAAPVRINGRALQASQFGRGPDGLYVFTATAAPPAATGADAPVVLTAMPVGLKTIARRYLVAPLTLTGPSAGRPDGASVEVRDFAGRTFASLAWTPASPGSDLYLAAIMPILLVVCSIAGIAFLTFGRGRRAARALIESEARATHMALHDALTGLPNRVLFTDRLGRSIEQLRRRGGAVAVLGLDLDRFKEVNDTFGHQFGDELLREVARRLAETCRTSDTVARLGGDEFAIIQSEATAGAAAGLARRLNEALAAPAELSIGRVFIGCSIGISLLDDPETDPVDALRQADLALYRAKDAGRGQYAFFEPAMDAAQRTRRTIEADLRDAIDNGGLQMAYQSQVDGAGKVTALEALVRWDHPERGPVAPEFFVPIAEECGLIDKLGVFTLRTAFRDSFRWPAPLKVAINISPAQLRLKSFVQTLESLLAETGADASRFELEITESVFLGDDPLVHETLRRLREMGFALALDDFGTGYSSLSYLRRYPVDKIKIDGSFTAALGLDTESDAVVGAIIKLAGALKLSVVAEGVETDEQRRRLTAAGCGDAQGFLFCRPMTADAMAETLITPAPPPRAIAAAE